MNVGHCLKKGSLVANRTRCWQNVFTAQSMKCWRNANVTGSTCLPGGVFGRRGKSSCWENSTTGKQPVVWAGVWAASELGVQRLRFQLYDRSPREKFGVAMKKDYWEPCRMESSPPSSSGLSLPFKRGAFYTRFPNSTPNCTCGRPGKMPCLARCRTPNWQSGWDFRIWRWQNGVRNCVFPFAWPIADHGRTGRMLCWGRGRIPMLPV